MLDVSCLIFRLITHITCSNGLLNFFVSVLTAVIIGEISFSHVLVYFFM